MKLKIGVILPSRGDRPAFLGNAKRLLENQTLKPDLIKIMDYVPESELCDITQRYRRAYCELQNQVDIILFMEDDDWYSRDYIETMVKEWKAAGAPELFGTNYTIYYHIKLFGYYTMYHDHRSSAMSTLIKAGMNFTWPADSEPYTDSHIWMVARKETGELLKGKVFKPSKIICLGIKHGVGMTGGRSHIERLHFYTNERGTNDKDKSFLRSVCDSESFEFYSNYFDLSTTINNNVAKILPGT